MKLLEINHCKKAFGETDVHPRYFSERGGGRGRCDHWPLRFR